MAKFIQADIPQRRGTGAQVFQAALQKYAEDTRAAQQAATLRQRAAALKAQMEQARFEQQMQQTARRTQQEIEREKIKAMKDAEKGRMQRHAANIDVQKEHLRGIKTWATDVVPAPPEFQPVQAPAAPAPVARPRWNPDALIATPSKELQEKLAQGTLPQKEREYLMERGVMRPGFKAGYVPKSLDVSENARVLTAKQELALVDSATRQGVLSAYDVLQQAANAPQPTQASVIAAKQRYDLAVQRRNIALRQAREELAMAQREAMSAADLGVAQRTIRSAKTFDEAMERYGNIAPHMSAKQQDALRSALTDVKARILTKRYADADERTKATQAADEQLMDGMMDATDMAREAAENGNMTRIHSLYDQLMRGLGKKVSRPARLEAMKWRAELLNAAGKAVFDRSVAKWSAAVAGMYRRDAAELLMKKEVPHQVINEVIKKLPTKPKDDPFNPFGIG